MHDEMMTEMMTNMLQVMMLRSIIYGQRLLVQTCRLNVTLPQLPQKFSLLGINTEFNIAIMDFLTF